MPDMEFNKDMDSYMKRRRTHSDYSYVGPRAEEKAQPEEYTPVEQDTYEEESEPTSAEPKQGFFSRVKNFFSSSDDEKPAQHDDEHKDHDYTPSVDIHEPCREDIKSLGKITLNVLRMLPERELVSFKSSEQYEALKDILRKHNLIKSE